uniref:Uncharacterized protein n=1 Tax=Romanomermis culicivorax TaxID=13658 RepID=A0A915KST9_ROMCU
MESDDYVPQFSQLLDSSGGQAIDVGNLVVDYAGGGQSQNASATGSSHAIDVDSSLVDPFIPPTPIPPYAVAGPDASLMNRMNVSYGGGAGQVFNQQHAQSSIYDQYSSPLANQQNATAYYAAASSAAQNQFTPREAAPAAVRGKKKQTKSQQQGGGPRATTPRVRNPVAVRQPQQQSTSRYADNFQINRPVYAAPQPPVGVYGAQVPMRPYNTSMAYDYGSQQQGNVGNSAQIYAGCAPSECLRGFARALWALGFVSKPKSER